MYFSLIIIEENHALPNFIILHHTLLQFLNLYQTTFLPQSLFQVYI